jgi:hypothetical protein
LKGWALVAVFALGLLGAFQVWVHSNGPVRPSSPWSLSERMEALRIDRSLPAAAQTQAQLALDALNASFEVREEAGPTLLRCPRQAELPALFESFVTNGSAEGCEAEAADDGGDVRVYQVAGRVSPVLPGAATTLAEQQLHDALWLPALQVKPGAALAAMKPGRLSACGAGQANCALSLSAGALLYCGDLRSCDEGACFQGLQGRHGDIQPDEVAASLAYAQTVSPRGPQVSEAITPATAARFVDSPPWGNAGPGSAETARDLRTFFEQHPRGLCLYVRGLDVERPREAQLAADALGFPVFPPFDPRAPERATPVYKDLQRASDDDEALAQLFSRCDLPTDSACKARRERLSVQLRSALGRLLPPLSGIEPEALLPYHVGSSGAFQLGAFDPLRVRLESRAEVAKSKSARGKLVVNYQPLWAESVAERRARCTPASVCVFHGLLGSEGRPEEGFHSLVGLFGRRGADARCVRRLFTALAASPDLPRLQEEAREPLGEAGRCATPTSLLPQAGCPAAPSAYGDASPSCPPLRLAWFAGEPWARTAADIVQAAARAHVAVSAFLAPRNAETWDVAITAAVDYARADSPSLASIAGPVVSPRGADLLAEYESALDFGGARSPSEVRALIEADVAREGPAPIFALGFVEPRTLTLPAEQAEAARSPWYLSRLFAAWASR